MNPFLNIVSVPDGRTTAPETADIKFDDSSVQSSRREFEKLYNENLSGSDGPSVTETPSQNATAQEKPSSPESGIAAGEMPKAINVIAGVRSASVASNEMPDIDALSGFQLSSPDGTQEGGNIVGLPGRDAALSLRSGSGAAIDAFSGLMSSGVETSILRDMRMSTEDILSLRTAEGASLITRQSGNVADDSGQAFNGLSRISDQLTSQNGKDTTGTLFIVDEKMSAGADRVVSEGSNELADHNLNIKEVRLSVEANVASVKAVNVGQSDNKGTAPGYGDQNTENERAQANELTALRGNPARSTNAGEGVQDPRFGLQKNGATSVEPILNHSTQGVDKPSDTGALTGAGLDVSKTGTADSELQMSQVRFVLPDNIDQKNINNNRVIFIKLEPEHLGTVRLTLSSHNSGIAGRMVVDNAAVQSVVESNLNSLFDELVDKGINLDSFQVSVGGGHIGQRFSSRQATPRTGRSSSWSDDRSKLDGSLPVSSGSYGSRLYIRSTGVNWLA
jgi:hypothetical protein